MRITCQSAAFAVALTEAIMGEGHVASWLTSHDTGRLVVVTDAPRAVVGQCLAIFGMGLA
jgi:hypothetical protein